MLPFSQVDQFPSLFEALEKLGLKVSLKQTSLEDAFLNFTNIKGLADGVDQESLTDVSS